MTAPTLDPLAQELLQAIAVDGMLPVAPANGKVALVVAVSGGLDSVCLAHLLHSLTPRLPVELHLAHVDHGLRPESPQDAAFVEQLAAAWGASFHQTRLDPARLHADPAGLEAAARQARYSFLRRVASAVAGDGQTPAIATGHHADDQAETVLLRLAAGSGVRGLAGMRRVTEWPADEVVSVPVWVMRPLLGVRRSRLLAYAQRAGLSWREDATNQDVAFARNRLRRLVLPQLELINPAAVENICRSVEILADAAQQISQIDDNLLATLVLEATPGQRMVLDLERLRRVSAPQLPSLIHSAMRRTFPHRRDVGQSHVAQIVGAVIAGRPTAGPHPVVDSIAWTTGATPYATPGAPGERRQPLAWLSLHGQGLLPVALTHPWLDPADWEGRGIALPAAGSGLVPGEVLKASGAPMAEAAARTWGPGAGIAIAAPAAVSTFGAINGWALHVEQAALTEQRLLPAACDPWQAWLDAERCAELLLTTPEPGMRVSPLGLHGGHKTLGDFFTDRKLPTSLRVGWPVVVDAATRAVVWVCGFAVSETAALRVGSRRALQLRWRPSQE